MTQRDNSVDTATRLRAGWSGRSGSDSRRPHRLWVHPASYL